MKLKERQQMRVFMLTTYSTHRKGGSILRQRTDHFPQSTAFVFAIVLPWAPGLTLAHWSRPVGQFLAVGCVSVLMVFPTYPSIALSTQGEVCKANQRHWISQVAQLTLTSRKPHGNYRVAAGRHLGRVKYWHSSVLRWPWPLLLPTHLIRHLNKGG